MNFKNHLFGTTMSQYSQRFWDLKDSIVNCGHAIPHPPYESSFWPGEFPPPHITLKHSGTTKTTESPALRMYLSHNLGGIFFVTHFNQSCSRT